MENQTLYGRKKTFKLPSGKEVTIREQNGEDDDILSNPVDARTLMNISRFIAGIVVDTDITPNRLLSVQDVHNMPSLDRYCIMFNSRIFSIGETLEFSYLWPNTDGTKREVEYEVNLKDEFLFDYSDIPSEEEMASKPNAIPFYPGNDEEYTITLSSGKQVKYHLLNAEAEQYLLNLPEDKLTKNQELIARNLQLKVGDNWEKVTSFRLFSTKDMSEIRAHVRGYDPIFQGTTTLIDPVTHQSVDIPIVGIDNFFFPRES